METWNTVKTGLLLAALTALFVVIGGALGGRVGMIFAFGLAIVMNMGAWWFSDKLALRFSGAREAGPAEAPELHRIVETLATRAGLPKPGVYIIDSETPNAFATGRSPSKSAVAVTQGIMRMLNRDELSGVIAHELAHIKNRDTLISSIAATIAGAIAMIAEIAQWSLIFGAFTGDDDNGGIADLLGSLLLIIVAPIAAMIVQMAISRAREFSADATGARIMGEARPLADALRKIELASRQMPMRVNPATSHQYIINPLAGGGLTSLFRTHPETEKRIDRLMAMNPRDLAVA